MALSRFSLILVLWAAAALAQPAQRLTILHTNDHHGHAWPDERQAGLAARATVVAEVKREAERGGWGVILLDGGDVNTGPPDSNRLRAEPDLKAMEAMGYQAMAMGNHEFDHPLEVLRLQRGWVSFPFLGANVLDRAKKRPLFQDWVLLKAKGVRVAVVGLTTPTTPGGSTRGHDKRLRFVSPKAVLQSLLPTLRAQSDLVVVLSHLGHQGDVGLAKGVEGIPVIVGAHSHTPLLEPLRVGGALLVRASPKNRTVGRLDLEVLNKKVKSYIYRALPTVGQAPDPAVARMLQEYGGQVGQDLDQVIAQALEPLTRRGLAGPASSSSLGNLVCQAMVWRTGADVALTNNGGLREDLPQGPIQMRHVLAALPFNNTVVLMEMKARDLIRVLEQSFRQRSGGFLQASGLTVTYRNNRVESVKVKGQPLDPESLIKVATNSFLARGGDHYSLLRQYQPLPLPGAGPDVAAEVISAYLRHLGTVAPPREVRVQAVP